MPKKYYSKSSKVEKIARDRIDFLFREAKKIFRGNEKLANSYVKLARRIAMKYRIKLPSKTKKLYCKNCHRLLVPGVSGRVRLHKSRLIYYCFACKSHTRQPIK